MLCAIERIVRDGVKPADFEFTIGAALAPCRSWSHANGKPDEQHLRATDLIGATRHHVRCRLTNCHSSNTRCGPGAVERNLKIERPAMRRILVGPIVALLAVSAQAQENVALKAGAGRGVVESYCNTCHSLDYLRINAPFLDRKGWETEVNKMTVAAARVAAEAASEAAGAAAYG